MDAESKKRLEYKFEFEMRAAVLQFLSGRSQQDLDPDATNEISTWLYLLSRVMVQVKCVCLDYCVWTVRMVLIFPDDHFDSGYISCNFLCFHL